MKEFDLVIIGAGPGGYVAAIRAAQLGKKVAIIEKTHMGGICLNWGCIPTKALLKSSEIYKQIKNASVYGINVKEATPDLESIVGRSRKIATQLSNGISFLMKKNKITVFMAKGELLENNVVKIDIDGKEEKIKADKIIIATGARPRILPQIGLDPSLNKNIWTSKEALLPGEVPKKLAVIGSGAIGIEFASFFNDLGSDVTIFEMMENILPAEDAEISNFAKKAFEKQGMKFNLGAQVKKVDKDGAKLTFADKAGKEHSESYDKIICAIGIVGNVENIGLEKLGIKTDRGHIVINENCQTNIPNIYAIGDVCGAPWLAHKASHEGIIAIEHMFKNVSHPLDVTKIPGCTYSHPQIASIGLSEAKAKEKYKDITVGRFPFTANGKALAISEPEGLVKTIYHAKTGQLLGAHMIGSEVTEMIQGYAIAMGCEATEAEIFETIFPHPTLSEMMHESSLDAFGRALHI